MPTAAALLPALAPLAACSPPRGEGGGETPDPADSGDTDETAEGPAAAESIAWRVHEEVGSIVVVSWEQTAPAVGYVEFRLEGEDWQSSPPEERGAGPQQELLLGVPFGAEVELRIALDGEEGQVLREVWSCGQGSGTIADYAGEARRLANGNTLLNCGVGGNIREYTPDCEVAWHLEWPNQNRVGRATFLADLYASVP